MKTSSFYSSLPTIKLNEPLYDLFGVAPTSEIEFSFADAVKIAGHACPTVAGSYLMTYHGIKALYPNEIPIRGNFKLHFSTDEAEGVTGVIANIMGTILGAAGVGGFKGLGGKYYRNNKILFNQILKSKVEIVRIDNNQSVRIDYFPEIIPSSDATSPLLSKILSNSATDLEKLTFQNLWNQRLEKILSIGFDKNNLIKIS